ncbi:hypothetical protein F2Q70_00022783 [Brassica cretica]|uniref:Pentatricopeptide repeat-containing protein n=5 Tax=Brassica TaxID=3705 RepID=A0A8S9GUE6_BRACR|nr:hypothetical protein F2Q70_00022783 [Brassica cretica]KAF3585831.1 hypothetical protein F2Q69_00030907 [Brassica cretica]KAF3605981.1 hypothetical protein DY000_02049596 [Brassica cretica]CAF1931883.1 unnamed protein product [Brassica napus]VDD45493.1 unnamed protein product [Brassica oleracea]
MLHGDTFTYNTLIHGYCKVGKLVSPKSLNLKEVKPDVVMYRTMIYGLCRKGLRHEADVMYRQMTADEFLQLLGDDLMSHLRLGNAD